MLFRSSKGGPPAALSAAASATVRAAAADAAVMGASLGWADDEDGTDASGVGVLTDGPLSYSRGLMSDSKISARRAVGMWQRTR